MQRFTFVSLVVALGVLFPAGLPAQARAVAGSVSPPSAIISLLGQAGGALSVVTVQGNFAYLGYGPRLAVLDVTVPTQPVLLGQSQPLTGTVEDIVISGTLAYSAASLAGLRVFDVSNPAAPVELGSYVTPGKATNLALTSHYAYLADGDSGLYVIDVADPAHPALTRFVSGVGYDVCEIEGHYAYWLGASSSNKDGILRVYDITNPANPVYAGGTWLEFAYSPAGMAVVGTTAYVAASLFYILDVSDPAHMVELSEYESPFAYVDVAVADGYAYLAGLNYATYDSSLLVMDVHDPAHPVEVGAFPMASYAYGPPLVSGSLAYVPDGAFGLRILDVSTPAVPVAIGFYSTLPPASEAAVEDEYACVLDGSKGLHVLDVHDPADPERAGVFAGVGLHWYMNINVSGQYAYLNDRSRLRIVDVSDPYQPHLTGTYTVPNDPYIRPLALSGHFAYFGTGAYHGLSIVDVSDPAQPTLAGQSAACGDPFFDIAVAGTTAYLLTEYDGMCIADVSNPAAPARLGTFDPAGVQLWDVVVAGTYVYIAEGETMHIVDVADPAHPVEVAAFGAGAEISDLAVAPGYVFLDDTSGVKAVDVTDASHPALVAAMSLPAYGRLAFDGTTLYVAAGQYGLYALRFTTDWPNRVLLPAVLRN